VTHAAVQPPGVRPWATLTLVALTCWVAVFALTLDESGRAALEGLLGLVPAALGARPDLLPALPPPLGFLGAAVLSDGPFAAALNVAALLRAGPRLEDALGTRRTALFCVATALAAGALLVLVAPLLAWPVATAGAVAAAVLAGAALLRPWPGWRRDLGLFLALATLQAPYSAGVPVLAWLGLAGGLALGILLALFLAAGLGAGARMARTGEKP